MFSLEDSFQIHVCSSQLTACNSNSREPNTLCWPQPPVFIVFTCTNLHTHACTHHFFFKPTIMYLDIKN